jgi:methylmalonyl-CoA mutase
VLPFDAALGEGGRVGRRIARNIQLILMEESHLHQVIDPAGGSFFVEAMSRRLAAEAWPMVQAIDGEGGMLGALRQGLVQDAIAATYMKRLSDVAHCRTKITGVSSFPNLEEASLEHDAVDLPRLAAEAEKRLGDRTRPSPIAAPLHPMRSATGFERLRDLSDVALAENGQRPRVFVVGIGPLAKHAAELAYLQNAFAAGGIETVTAETGADVQAIGEAFAGAGTAVACLCGIDRKAPEAAAPLVQALQAKGAIAVYAAGRPNEAIQAIGIDGFVYTGVNLLGFLEDVQSLIMGEAA